MDEMARRSQSLKDAFLVDVDRDTQAFNAVMAAMRLPKASTDEKERRAGAIDAANRGATAVPLEVLRRSVSALELADLASREGNPLSLSDAGVAALCGLACAEGAFYNVRINLRSLASSTASGTAAFVSASSREAEELLARAQSLADTIRERVREALA
jgi:glutamate formiminotransferase/formiminotetrahydrofolate cyclodeaminase